MRLRLALAALLLAAPAAAQTGELVATDALRICADPANLPFSNERGEGFENRIAALLGRALDRKLDTVFFPQVQGFVRNTLRAGRCDLVMGTVAGDDLMQNTNPYYHTSYVLAFRRGAEVPERLDDPRMKALRLGAIARTPPIDLLVRHGLMTNTRFFPLAVDTRYESPGADLLRAVAEGELDAALVWGPIAGYQAKVKGLPIEMRALPSEPGATRMDFRITMGVRGQEPEWRRRINAAIREHQGEIDAILRDYGVPMLDAQGRLLPP
ncbi:quinoprotein dehydrogenase-associated putative ABC transporter substrate-binding protein [Roseicella aquatilis]|uniref:Quinoprotein dehydrogenase-associated putative ABC transporter substrate-binding protein n=1 Tax=Roseicella aquatilis TaxID=2527868 RepID=A0A4R4DRA5_9PROT|nr:quinoprotein dehydrogenase-associated putative ABC transporter substrate-binding protein [Roseicella aquatilis]TCZ64897.1 quinoprotein dehydrogenase-associated putative ABC transporter substrate-binding protein [Roseicella aquatilis]